MFNPHPIIFLAFASALTFSAAVAGVVKPWLPHCEARIVEFGACLISKAIK